MRTEGFLSAIALLIVFAFPSVAEEIPEAKLLQAFEAVDVMHIDFHHEIHRFGDTLVIAGQMLFVREDESAQFHVPTTWEILGRDDSRRKVDYLYQAGLLHVTDYLREPANVRRSALDPSEMPPPGGPLLFDVLKKSYTLTLLGEAKPESGTVRIGGILRDGENLVVPYARFEADFETATGLLTELRWLDGPGESTATVRYSAADLDPDWDPVRLVFDPPPGANMDAADH